MSLPQSVAEVIRQHVTLEVESIDRTYLNVYVGRLPSERGVVGFFRFHRGETFASSVLMGRISNAFLSNIDTFCKQQQVPLISFKKKQRKDDVAAEYLARFTQSEGVMFVGKAQEKTPATSASASGWRICPRCGRSAFKPTDVFWTSNRSATTARLPKKRFVK